MDNFSNSKVNIRLFVGIPIPINKVFENLICELRNQFGKSIIKWVENSQVHLTIKFIGEVPEFYLNSVVSLIKTSVIEIEPFNLTIENLGFFGKPSPKVLWLGVNPEKTLEKCFRNINANLAELGIDQEQKDYIPHITIARIKHFDEKVNINTILNKQVGHEIQQIKVTNIELISSKLNPWGPEYKTLKVFPFLDSIH